MRGVVTLLHFIYPWAPPRRRQEAPWICFTGKLSDANAPKSLSAALAYAASVKCPIDKYDMYFTGKTRTEMGKMLYQYKCPNGHIYWIVQ